MSNVPLVFAAQVSERCGGAAPCGYEGFCRGYGSRQICPPLIVLAVRASNLRDA
jgi:hypothetical protein